LAGARHGTLGEETLQMTWIQVLRKMEPIFFGGENSTAATKLHGKIHGS